jgi:hypothetical protein
MRDWIAGTMLVLGALLVISGGTVIILKSLQATTSGGDAAATPAAPARTGGRLVAALRSLSAADRLIAWGALLLVLGAIAAGAIAFNVSADTGTR